MKRLILTIALLILVLPSWALAADYYVKNGGSDAAAGTSDALAWATIAKVNSTVSASGSRVFFKCGSTWNNITDAYLNIDWASATVGAYYMTGGAGTETIGVSGTKPKLDGQIGAGAEFSTAVSIVGAASSDATIQDLWITRSYGYGILFKSTSSGGIAQRNTISDVRVAGIQANGAGTREYLYNEISQFSMQYSDKAGSWSAAIRMRSGDRAAFNLVHDGFGEGINPYDTTGPIIEYNKLWNVWSAHIYLDSVNSGIVRYNMIFGTTDTTYAGYGSTGGIWHFYGIFINAEAVTSGATNNCLIYGNFVAGLLGGIRIANTNASSGVGNLVYNNTLVDNYRNFSMSSTVTTYNATTLSNNLFYLSGESKGGQTPAQTAINNTVYTFNENFWSSDPPNTGYGTTTNGTVALAKTTGWLAIANEAGVSIDDFALTASSECKNNAPTLGTGYAASFISTGADYTDPITPLLQSQFENPVTDSTPWDFGAWVYYEQEEVIPDPPAECTTGNWWTPINEAFEGTNCASDTCTFCTTAGITLGSQGCTDTTTGTVIDCASSDWAHTGSASLKMVFDSDTSTAFKVLADGPSGQARAYYRWAVKTGTSTGTTAEITRFPDFAPDGTPSAVAASVTFRANNGAWKLFLRNGATYSTNYFNLAAATEYQIEADIQDNNTCTMKVWDANVDAVLNDGGSVSTITVAGADVADIEFAHFFDTFDSSTAATFYIDNLEMSNADWVGPVSSGADVTAPTVTAIGVWDGDSCEQDVTDTWGAETVTICMELSEDVIVADASVDWRMYAGPAAADYVSGSYFRKTYEGATPVLLMDFTIGNGMRVANPQMSLATGGSIADNATNALVWTASEGDLDGTGTITIEVNSSSSPFTIGLFTDENDEEYQGTWGTPEDFYTAVTYGSLPGDKITVGTFSGTVNATGAGTAGHPVTVTFDPGAVITGAWTLDENYWTVNGNGGSIVGDVTVTGTNVTISRVKHNSTVTLGVDSIHQVSLIPTGSTIQIPEGATGVVIYNDTIAGTLVVSETCVLMKNLIVVAVNAAGLGAGETATFTNSYFIQSQAVIEATGGGGAFVFTGCVFSQPSPFVSPTDFHLAATATNAIDKGVDLGASYQIDLDGEDQEDHGYPVQAINVLPADGAEKVARKPLLTSDSYANSGLWDIGAYAFVADSHTASQWQVCSDALCSSVAWDSGEDASNLLSISVAERLGSKTTYYFRARHYTDAGAGEWSATTEFETKKQVAGFIGFGGIPPFMFFED